MPFAVSLSVRASRSAHIYDIIKKRGVRSCNQQAVIKGRIYPSEKYSFPRLLSGATSATGRNIGAPVENHSRERAWRRYEIHRRNADITIALIPYEINDKKKAIRAAEEARKTALVFSGDRTVSSRFERRRSGSPR